MNDRKKLTEADLYQFTGSEHWYSRPQFESGVHRRREIRGRSWRRAYWLLDTIALAQRTEKKVASTRFQLWTLKVNADRTATLTCVNGTASRSTRRNLEFTDFPLPEIKFYFTNNTIYLPSEH